ncbi:hypothetical protein ADUPG1_012883 [Aduncisulcus paluster]|uniref:Uncharacterized protein n=1 Tax=Aduncisulcus paluster TaxID=2918883 RepID=A0ABQ5K102_9EUKA|nr:hypothetical protein ADUPG1_012883 [Aduncisulcus paluster]
MKHQLDHTHLDVPSIASSIGKSVKDCYAMIPIICYNPLAVPNESSPTKMVNTKVSRTARKAITRKPKTKGFSKSRKESGPRKHLPWSENTVIQSIFLFSRLNNKWKLYDPYSDILGRRSVQVKCKLFNLRSKNLFSKMEGLGRTKMANKGVNWDSCSIKEGLLALGAKVEDVNRAFSEVESSSPERTISTVDEVSLTETYAPQVESSLSASTRFHEEIPQSLYSGSAESLLPSGVFPSGLTSQSQESERAFEYPPAHPFRDAPLYADSYSIPDYSLFQSTPSHRILSSDHVQYPVPEIRDPMGNLYSTSSSIPSFSSSESSPQAYNPSVASLAFPSSSTAPVLSSVGTSPLGFQYSSHDLQPTQRYFEQQQSVPVFEGLF